MKILAIHNFHRKGSASGDDQVFKSETALLEDHGHEIVRYTVSNDEFDNTGVIGKFSAALGMLWSFKNYKKVKKLVETHSYFFSVTFTIDLVRRKKKRCKGCCNIA